MTREDVLELEQIIRAAKLITLILRETKVGLGSDMQVLIADALHAYKLPATSQTASHPNDLASHPNNSD